MRRGPAVAVYVLLTAPDCSQEPVRSDLGLETDSGGTTDELLGDTSSDGGSTTKAERDFGNGGAPPLGWPDEASCGLIDILFVIDNSAAMRSVEDGEEDGDMLPSEWESGVTGARVHSPTMKCLADITAGTAIANG